MTTPTDDRRDWVTTLIREATDGGHRLGVIVERGDVVAVDRGIELLSAAGLPPSRRLARLGPRYGESTIRPDDLVDFGSRYGHEYVVAILRFDTIPMADERALIESTLLSEGCDVVWQ